VPTTPLNVLPTPGSLDSPNGPAQIASLAAALDTKVYPRFTTVAARNTAYDAFVAAGGAMVRGMRAVVGTVEHVYGGTGPAHVAASWIEPTWKTYTPVWGATGAGTQPSVGNGSLTGRYRVIDDTTVLLRILLTQGTTTDGGSGNAGQFPYYFTLPSGMTNTTLPAVFGGFYKTSADEGGLSGLCVAGADRISPIRADQNNALISKGLLDSPGTAYIFLNGFIELA